MDIWVVSTTWLRRFSLLVSGCPRRVSAAPEEGTGADTQAIWQWRWSVVILPWRSCSWREIWETKQETQEPGKQVGWCATLGMRRRAAGLFRTYHSVGITVHFISFTICSTHAGHFPHTLTLDVTLCHSISACAVLSKSRTLTILLILEEAGFPAILLSPFFLEEVELCAVWSFYTVLHIWGSSHSPRGPRWASGLNGAPWSDPV